MQNGEGGRRFAPSEDELRRFTDDARRTEAAASRRREQWLRRQAQDEGTFNGLLVDLTERQVVLAIQTRADRLVRGRAVTLGADFIAVVGTPDGTTLVPADMMVAVSPEPGTARSVGDRPETTTATFASTMADLAAERPSVSVHTAGSALVAGTLWGVGRDFAVIRTPVGETYVPFSAVNDLIWR